MSRITSPCTGVCQIADGRCIGCHRTMSQITQWARMDESKRRRIMRDLEQREAGSHAQTRD